MATASAAMIDESRRQKSSRPLIRMRAVSKTYVTASSGTVHAVDRVDLDIADGEFVCIVGPSGCGKSTLLRMLAGLDTNDGGRLLLDGHQVIGPSAQVGV